jgi:hypothetical protein
MEIWPENLGSDKSVSSSQKREFEAVHKKLQRVIASKTTVKKTDDCIKNPLPSKLTRAFRVIGGAEMSAWLPGMLMCFEGLGDV